MLRARSQTILHKFSPITDIWFAKQTCGTLKKDDKIKLPFSVIFQIYDSRIDAINNPSHASWWETIINH